jgi:hypothetical protein
MNEPKAFQLNHSIHQAWIQTERTSTDRVGSFSKELEQEIKYMWLLELV